MGKNRISSNLLWTKGQAAGFHIRVLDSLPLMSACSLDNDRTFKLFISTCQTSPRGFLLLESRVKTHFQETLKSPVKSPVRPVQTSVPVS